MDMDEMDHMDGNMEYGMEQDDDMMGEEYDDMGQQYGQEHDMGDG